MGQVSELTILNERKMKKECQHHHHISIYLVGTEHHTGPLSNSQGESKKGIYTSRQIVTHDGVKVPMRFKANCRKPVLLQGYKPPPPLQGFWGWGVGLVLFLVTDWLSGGIISWSLVPSCCFASLCPKMENNFFHFPQKILST